ncbi:MAG TPA: ABC transporter permease, partial [Planctomycetaceae bacterium]|nr:ABC transporter permease [Planctomycetaceae bacterium]
FPILYTRYSQAVRFAPPERKVLSFILAQPRPEFDPRDVCRRIEAQTRLQALTRDEFLWKTIRYYLVKTGIPVNFGVTVLLGFLVGTAIAGQTFYLFT